MVTLKTPPPCPLNAYVCSVLTMPSSSKALFSATSLATSSHVSELIGSAASESSGSTLLFGPAVSRRFLTASLRGLHRFLAKLLSSSIARALFKKSASVCEEGGVVTGVRAKE